MDYISPQIPTGDRTQRCDWCDKSLPRDRWKDKAVCSAKCKRNADRYWDERERNDRYGDKSYAVGESLLLAAIFDPKGFNCTSKKK